MYSAVHEQVKWCTRVTHEPLSSYLQVKLRVCVYLHDLATRDGTRYALFILAQLVRVYCVRASSTLPIVAPPLVYRASCNS